MTLKATLLVSFSLFLTLAAASCQTYDFEPVSPLAIAQTSKPESKFALAALPNVMLVVDKSGSMNRPTVSDPACTCGVGGTVCSVSESITCKPRWLELQKSITSFLNASASLGRWGLQTFPADVKCTAPETVRLDIINSDDVQAIEGRAAEVRDIINAIQMGGSVGNTAGQPNYTGGGTPSGRTLEVVGQLPSLNDAKRNDFIIFLTDGEPNCNDANPNNGDSPAACQCTLPNNAPCENNTTPGQTNFYRNGCLDKDHTVAVVQALNDKGIRTIIVGFGSELDSGRAADVLQAMGVAGGFRRTCPNGDNSECGADDTCNASTKLCQRAFFKAANAESLTAALDAIRRDIGSSEPCTVTLNSEPSDERFISVLIDGESVDRGADTWEYNAAPPNVTFVGALCNRILNADAIRAVEVEVRVVEKL